MDQPKKNHKSTKAKSKSDLIEEPAGEIFNVDFRGSQPFFYLL